MYFDVVGADWAGGYCISLTFRDGTSGIVDFEPLLRGPLFEPLRVLSRFQTFRIDRELGTVGWPNGADISPVYLYEYVRAAEWAEERYGANPRDRCTRGA